VRLEDLNRAHINEFVAWRKESHQVSNRTVNLDMIALNNCLKHAVEEGRLGKTPTADWRCLNHVSLRRPLWTGEQIEAVCCAAKAEG
jgi:hypothetical protein